MCHIITSIICLSQAICHSSVIGGRLGLRCVNGHSLSHWHWRIGNKQTNTEIQIQDFGSESEFGCSSASCEFEIMT